MTLCDELTIDSFKFSATYLCRNANVPRWKETHRWFQLEFLIQIHVTEYKIEAEIKKRGVVSHSMRTSSRMPSGNRPRCPRAAGSVGRGVRGAVGATGAAGAGDALKWPRDEKPRRKAGTPGWARSAGAQLRPPAQRLGAKAKNTISSGVDALVASHAVAAYFLTRPYVTSPKTLCTDSWRIFNENVSHVDDIWKTLWGSSSIGRVGGSTSITKWDSSTQHE